MLSDKEKLLAEGIESMLQANAKLGLDIHDPDEDGFSSQFPYIHEHIDQQFRLLADEKDFKYFDSICASFSKTHAHKYLDSPSFWISFDKEMSAQAIPNEERQQAIALVEEIIDTLTKDRGSFKETDLGAGTDLEGIRDVSSPEGE